MNKSAWLVVAILLLLFVIILLLASQPQSEVTALRSRGTIKSEFKVYDDVDRTNETSTIDWGELEPGENCSVTVYLVASSVDVNASNWVPVEAQNFLQLTSEFVDGELALTLHVSPEIKGVTEFSFDIIITKK